MRSSSFLFIVSSVDAACFTTSESSFKRRSFVRCKAFLEAKTKRLAVYVAVLERYCIAMRLKRKNTNLKLNHNISIITARTCFCGRVSVFSLTQLMRGFKELTAIVLNRGRINSVGRALDCRAGGGRFDSRGRTNGHGLKITVKVLPLPCKRLDLRVARMITENGGLLFSRRRKNSVPINTFVLNILTLK